MIFKDLVQRLVEIYKQNSYTNDVKRKNMIERFVFYTEYIFKVGVSAYTLCALILLLVPIYIYFVDGGRIVLFNFFFPGTDETTFLGCVINFVLQVLELFFGLVGSAGSDFFFAMLIINVPVMSNILKDNFYEMNEILKEKKIDKLKVHGKFLNIILIYREMAE